MSKSFSINETTIMYRSMILVEAPVFVSKLTTQEVKQGETAVFEGKIDGYPVPKVTWLLNGKPLTPKDGATIENSPASGDVKLTINNVDLQQHADRRAHV